MTITKTIELLKAGEIQVHFDNGNKNHLQKLLSMAFPNGDYIRYKHRYFTNTPESATPMNSSRKKPFKGLLIKNLSEVVGLDLKKGDKCQVHFGCNSGWCDVTYIGYLNGKIVVENCNGVLTDGFYDLRLSEVTQEEEKDKQIEKLERAKAIFNKCYEAAKAIIDNAIKECEENPIPKFQNGSYTQFKKDKSKRVVDLRMSDTTEMGRKYNEALDKELLKKGITKPNAKEEMFSIMSKVAGLVMPWDVPNTFQNGEMVEVSSAGTIWSRNKIYIGIDKYGLHVVQDGGDDSGVCRFKFCRRPKVEEKLTAYEIIDLIFSKLPLTEQAGSFRNRLRFLIGNIK